MKKTAKTQVSSSASHKGSDGHLTTAEISRLREQKRMRRHTITALIGLGLMIGGTVAYFSPHANASDEIIVEELDASQIVDIPEPTDADFAYGTTGGQSGGTLLMAEGISEIEPNPDFLSVTQEEATQRADAASEADLPQEGTYDPTHLLVDMASDSTQDEALAAISDAGCTLESMFSESDGRFGASFSVAVPSDASLIDAYKKFLANPKVYSCGFNIYFEPSTVRTDDMFVLDGVSDWSDGTESYDTDLSLNQLDDFSVFDDPDETYGDLNSEEFSIAPESADGFVLQQTFDDPNGKSTERWEYRHLNYEGVWNIARSNSRVTVAVIDTGVYGQHRDLQNVLYEPVYVDKDGNAFPQSKEEMTDPSDIGHGTHVAGIIGATANNQFGISGLSYNARIMPIKLHSDSNGAISAASLKAAFNYIASANQGRNPKLTKAQKANVRVVNVSLGQPMDTASAAQWAEKILAPAIANLKESGTLVVVAAGNQTDTAKVPYASAPAYKGNAQYDNVLSVINLEANSDDITGTPHRMITSNYNMLGRRDCEISAPGTNIYSANNQTDCSFAYLTGTSQAAPIVSATAALVFSANPDLTPMEAKDIICRTATDLGPSGFDEETGYGEINPSAAVAEAKLTATVDDVMDIGKENSNTLKNIALSINGQRFPAFTYERIGYDLEYNGMRESIPETAFHFSNIPSGLSLYRRVSDPDYSDEMINAVNGVKYREVSQVITFLFASKNAQLSDKNALYGIYAFYIKYNLITGTLGAEDTSEGNDQSPDINEVINEGTTEDLLPAIAGMELVTLNDQKVVYSFDAELPNETQYCRVESNEKVDSGIEVINLPEGWGSIVTSDESGSDDTIFLTDDAEPLDAFTRPYTVTVSNYLNSFIYHVVLYAESSSQAPMQTTAGLDSETESQDNPATNGSSIEPGNNFAPTSEKPVTDYSELRSMKCFINNKEYAEFNTDKTSYIIYFKVGSTFPPAPSLASVPNGWLLSSNTTTALPKSPKHPYGGTKHILVVTKEALRRQYEFDYAYSSDSGATVASNGNAKQSSAPSTQTPQATAQTVADSPNEVVTTYVEPGTQTDDTTTTTVQVGGFTSQPTQEINAGNAPTQWKPNADTTGSSTPTSTSADANKSIADTSPLSNLVSGGTLTQTGDAVVIVTGGIISGASVIGLILARRRMRMSA